jgi:hypothetical protein
MEKVLTNVILIQHVIRFDFFTLFYNFEYDVPWEQIRDCSLDISVMDFDTIGSELLGRLVLGGESLRI